MSTSVGPQTAVLESPIRLRLEPRHRSHIALGLGLLLIVAGNFFLRNVLEHSRLPPYPTFPNDRVELTWRQLLPVDIGAAENSFHAKGTYHWMTTGLTVVVFFEQFFSPNAVFYTLNALSIIATFVCTWLMFRSAIFSYTATICMAFGTQLHWVYVCSTLQAFYLYVIFLEANLLCLLKVMRTGERRWQAGYAATLVLLALNHEQWLSYFAFLASACVVLWLYARRAAPEMKPRIAFVGIFTVLLAAGYLAIRLQYGEQQTRAGDEDQMIFAYHDPVLAIEDFISNVFSLLYIAISNYFPPYFVGSNSLYRLGPDGVIAAQEGYHASQTHLVAMHHVFYWYFFAGIVFAVFAYFLVRNTRAAIEQGSTRQLHLALCMLMIAAGFAIHSLLKYRPYMSVPLLTYKCMTSNVGVAYLIAYCLMYARGTLSRRWLFVGLVALVWGVIIHGALARPAYLNSLSQSVGLSGIPDPLRHVQRNAAP